MNVRVFHVRELYLHYNIIIQYWRASNQRSEVAMLSRRFGKLRLGCRYSSNFANSKITKFVGLLVGALKSTVLLTNFINFVLLNADSILFISYICAGNSSTQLINFLF